MNRLSNPLIRLGKALSLGLMVGLCAPLAQAQGLFSPAVTVNGDVVTNYEIEQRARFLTILNAPGNRQEVAREQLIQDRLKIQTTKAAGIEPAPEDIENGMVEFAARGNLDRDRFVALLAQNGVGEETLRDFVAVGLAWREYMRGRFLGRARPTEAEIDRAVGAQGGRGAVEVLLSEIIIPLTPDNAEEVQAEAQRIASHETFDAFSADARKFSATASRERGGRLDWLSINKLPPQLRPLLLQLSPGEVTAPLNLPDAVALFQLRDIRETTVAAPTYSAIEYAAYYIAGGRTPEALAKAEQLKSQVDVCDDLYGIAKGQPEEVLERESKAPAELPKDFATELAKLDDTEVSTALTRNNGQVLVFLMLCGRTAAQNEDASREEVAQALTQQRLNAFSNSFLDQLQAEAEIVEQ